jgi:general secretion pathway protein L
MSIALFLPRHADEPWRWLRLADGRVAAAGEGVPEADGRLVAVAPADAVTLHWAALPDRSSAQTAAAARILIAEASAAPPGELHVAVGREGDAAERPIAVVAVGRMAAWLAGMATAGIDADAIVPAPMLLPRPIEGHCRADLPNGAAVRGGSTGFADEPPLTDLLTGGTPAVPIEREALEGAIAAAVAAPPLDLRQGPFARRRRRAIDWPLVRRLALLAGAILAVTLLIDLVRIARYAIDAGALEARAAAVARSGLARGAPASGDADRLLAERLAALQGPGRGFSRTAAAVLAAIRDTEGSEATGMNFDPNGDLRVRLATDGEAQANAVKARIEAAGFVVQASPFAAAGNRLTGEVTVRAP